MTDNFTDVELEAVSLQAATLGWTSCNTGAAEYLDNSKHRLHTKYESGHWWGKELHIRWGIHSVTGSVPASCNLVPRLPLSELAAALPAVTAATQLS
jgi:hypothetical protein